MSLAYYKSPIGMMAITGNDYCITKVLFVDNFIDRPSDVLGKEVRKCIEELDEYFKGNRESFTVRIDPEGSEFNKSIWKLLQGIEYGKTISYLELARRFGNEKAARAVGKANSMNPLAVIVPCHRVVGLTGEMVGYAGGLEKKRWLLDHEKAAMPGGQLRLF